MIPASFKTPSLACLIACLSFTAPTFADTTLIGVASIPADARDDSGFTDTLSDGTPNNQIGGLGSAITYTGQGERYIAVPDRGPNNGEAAYTNRFYELELHIDPANATPVQVKIVKTTPLTNENGQHFTGLATAFDAGIPATHLRLDPEGVRVGTAGTVFISDEYGPSVYEFDRNGKRLRWFDVPAAFSIKRPDGDKKKEIENNPVGRTTNKGFEGLAISPDGKRLYAILQAPLQQDQGKKGVNTRMVEFDVASGKALRQLVVQMAQQDFNFNELLAINDHEFLAIERDSHAGEKASAKKIIHLDIAGATDVSGVASFDAKGLPAGVVPVATKPFIDLLDAKFGLAGKKFPEKIEGLAWGPDLKDGRHVLVVSVDNDFLKGAPNTFWVFAVDAKDVPGLVTPAAK